MLSYAYFNETTAERSGCAETTAEVKVGRTAAADRINGNTWWTHVR